MTFRKRTAGEKTLLQKGFPPGPPFRKLLNGCGVALHQRQHDLKKLSCKKEPPGLPPEQNKQSIAN